MATTQDRIREIEQLEALWRESASEPAGEPAAPEVSSAPAPVRLRLVEALSREVDVRWASGTLVAWLVLFTVAIGIQPPPADPSAAVPFLDQALGGLLLFGLVATMTGLAIRRRWGMAAGLATGGLLLGLSLACPATGHHALAAWWYGQVACAGALCAVSGAGLKRA